jgi:hypothetical protein
MLVGSVVGNISTVVRIWSMLQNVAQGFIIYALHQILLGNNQGGGYRCVMYRVWG